MPARADGKPARAGRAGAAGESGTPPKPDTSPLAPNVAGRGGFRPITLGGRRGSPSTAGDAPPASTTINARDWDTPTEAFGH